MVSYRLEMLANDLLAWIWVVPCGSNSKAFIFDLREFQRYAKHFTNEDYSLPEIHQAVHLLTSMKAIQPVDGWPKRPDDHILLILDSTKNWYY